MKQFPEWAMYKEVGVTLGSETGDVERKQNVQTMPNFGEEFGFLVIFGEYREENHCDEGYQWVI